jgi:hypothetical protein
MFLTGYDIDPGFYRPDQTWTAVNSSSDIIATKQDLAALEQKIEELQKKIDKLTGPCYCESLL